MDYIGSLAFMPNEPKIGLLVWCAGSVPSPKSASVWSSKDIRPHIFDLLDYVTRDLKNCDFKKKKKKKKKKGGIWRSSSEKCNYDSH